MRVVYNYRGIAVGTAAMFSRIGGIVAPYIILLQNNVSWLPNAIFSAFGNSFTDYDCFRFDKIFLELYSHILGPNRSLGIILRTIESLSKHQFCANEVRIAQTLKIKTNQVYEKNT